MLDFPASPSVGQKYPASPLAGIPTYTWDGEKWTTQGGSIVSASPGTLLPLMDAKPALVGVSTNFSREDHVHPVDTSRAPFDAMAYSGLQINGGMEVSQSRGATGGLDTGGYIVDGWKQFQAGTMVTAVAQFTGPVGGFPYFLGVTTTTAQASLGSSDFTVVSQPIEGWRCARLQWGTANAQPITIGFWSDHHRTGVYTGTIRSSISNRTYGFTYTHNVADVSQYNVVTVPGDTAGTWAADNRIGLEVVFAMAAGSAATVPSANTWTTGNYIAAPGQINAVAATSDAFRLTGVIVLPGNEAPSAARSPFVMRPYDQELVTCMRYYRRVGGTANNDLGIAGWGTIAHAIPIVPAMRASPSISTFGTIYGLNISVTNYYSSPNIFSISITAANGAALTQYASNPGGIILDARL